MSHRIPQLGLAVLLASSAPVGALQVGWSVDIHQNQFVPCADDFHVWGVLESLPDQYGEHPPTLLAQDNVEPYDKYQGQICYSDIFDHFSYTIGGPQNPNLPRPPGYVGPWPPTGPPFYYFEANWWSDENCVEFCHWAHFGLKFEENDGNYGYWLQGRWTAEHGAQYATSNTPMLGFAVIERQGPGPVIRLQNANTVPIGVAQMQTLLLPAGTNFDINNLTTNHFDVHPEFVWTQVPGGLLPAFVAPSSFFDVFLESIGTAPHNGQVLLARQQLTHTAVGGRTETFWQYQLHESPAAVTPTPARPSLRMIARALLEITGTTGATYRVEYSDNLADWHTLTSIVLPVSPFIWPDSTASGSAARFYRAASVP
ncbi:MAG: hypothetical protein NTW21_17155 [Verrucomicrobia bacterium]|nr:hypothetical protein [Verrucomicrobiota bacterium]